MTEFLSPLQVRALEALATYRFLNRMQMQRVGVAKDPKDLRKHLSPLINKRLIGRTEKPPTLPSYGRLPHVYWLYQSGAEALSELHGEPAIQARTREYAARNELPHLNAVVDAHIALRAWADSAGAAVDWFKGDYEPGASRGRKATTLPYNSGRDSNQISAYTPDAIAQITLADGIARILVFEVYRGGWRYTLSHFRKELPKLRQVCDLEAVEEHHGLKKTDAQARFLILFNDADMRDRALDRWNDAGAEPFSAFYIKAMDELGEDFPVSWRQPGRPATNLF